MGTFPTLPLVQTSSLLLIQTSHILVTSPNPRWVQYPPPLTTVTIPGGYIPHNQIRQPDGYSPQPRRYIPTSMFGRDDLAGIGSPPPFRYSTLPPLGTVPRLLCVESETARPPSLTPHDCGGYCAQSPLFTVRNQLMRIFCKVLFRTAQRVKSPQPR
jgi:hypothetical protein